MTMTPHTEMALKKVEEMNAMLSNETVGLIIDGCKGCCCSRCNRFEDIALCSNDNEGDRACSRGRPCNGV